jgi:hypothetical protein
MHSLCNLSTYLKDILMPATKKDDVEYVRYVVKLPRKTVNQIRELARLDCRKQTEYLPLLFSDLYAKRPK